MIATAYPIPSRLEWLQRRADERHQWLHEAAAQVKRHKTVDRLNGIEWHQAKGGRG